MSTPIQNNSEALQRILQTVNSLPDAGTGSGSGGVTVQRDSGNTFTVDSSGSATVNCGFQPDMVAIDLGEANSAKAVVVAPFYEISADNVSEAGSYETTVWTDDNILILTTLSQTSTGFSVYMRAYDFSQDKDSLPTKTYNYVAVKYT